MDNDVSIEVLKAAYAKMEHLKALDRIRTKRYRETEKGRAAVRRGFQKQHAKNKAAKQKPPSEAIGDIN